MEGNFIRVYRSIGARNSILINGNNTMGWGTGF